MLMKTSARRDDHSPPSTLFDAIGSHAVKRPAAPALILPNGTATDYLLLHRQIEQIGAQLARAGIGSEDWVVVLLPDGPDLAITVAAVACNAAAVPLNPTLTAAELDDLFAYPQIKAVILADETRSSAREIAGRHGICQFAALSESGNVRLALRSSPLDSRTPGRASTGDDAAMILRTSGTTDRPKLVAVTHRNLLSTAAAIEDWFALTPDDRVLGFMPLYYAVGLKVSLFTPLIVGASIACPVRSAGADFAQWLTAFEPTWYSAGPTLQQSVLESALASGRRRHSLRFIHSGAAPLPNAIHDALEEFFGVPVLQTYGLSEVGLVAANTFAPSGRKRGTVGKVRSGELAIRAEDGRVLPAGELGEIVVQGPCVTPGYVNDSAANKNAFADGWFRTGDLGRLDQDGFLTVVGRLKELINRGGEKIAPAEVDAALLRHPAVAEAATFAVAHPRLGEDLAAAVVRRPQPDVTALELRRFLGTTLAPFKVPRRIHFVAALPKGVTGKVLRQELAAMFPGTITAGRSSRWETPLEIEIAETWRRLLGREDIARDDDFFELGGDSLLAAQMLLEVERLTGLVLADNILFEAATIAQLAQHVVQHDRTSAPSLLVKLQTGSDRLPFFFVDGDLWGGGYYTRKIAQLLGPKYPFYNLRSHALRGRSLPTIERMARDYRGLITTVQPHGPYRLAGHCNGAVIAWEVARQLVAAGEPVEFVAMVEPITLNARPLMRLLAKTFDRAFSLATPDRRRREEWLGVAMSFVWRAIWTVDKLMHARACETTARDSLRALTLRIAKRDPQAADESRRVQKECREAMARYLPQPLAIKAVTIVSESHGDSVEFAAKAWRHLTGRFETAIVPGQHITCITTHADVLVSHLRQHLELSDRVIGVGLGYRSPMDEMSCPKM